MQKNWRDITVKKASMSEVSISEVSIIHKLDISSAPLPVAYEKAKLAISECNNIDECKDWSDKAQALASYARQAGDDELEQMSKRIRARAMRRCGELLKMFDGRSGQNFPNAKRDGAVPFSKSQIGEAAGLSERQIKQSNNLSNISENDFNHQIESDQVPTLTQLSDQGKKKIDYLYKPKPTGFADAIHLKGALKELYGYTKKYDPEYIINAMDDIDKKEVSKIIGSLELWFDKFIVKV